MKALLDSAPKGIALLSFAILALTVIHEWGYFWVVGSHFQTVASAYDYLSNSILWLPQNLIFVLTALLVEVILLHLFGAAPWDKKRDDDGALGYKAKVELRKKIRRSLRQYTLGSFALAALIALGFYFFAPPYIVFFYALPLFFIYTATFSFLVLLFEEQLAKILNRAAIVAILVVPSVLIFDFMIGVQEAHFDINRISDLYVIVYKDDHSTDVNSNKDLIQVLRSFDKGLLIRDPNREKIDFVRWDSIKSLVHSGYAEGEVPRGCIRFPKVCRLTPPEP